jgi:hypothetical protein
MKIKGFNKDLQCRGMQFEIGKEYKIELNGRKLELCTDTCFHYCDSLQQVHEFYSVLEDNRFCEIEVLGEEVSDEEKCGSNHIKIVREIVGEELNILKGLVSGNSGIFNSGSYNSGGYNSGDYNSGDYNSGDHNSGNRNSGNRNSGYRNSGGFNSGNGNSGYRNSGDYNSGNRNSGYRNSGYRNSGGYNSGGYNSGDYNSGDYNSGDHNSGSVNSGNRNSGGFNSGGYNSGLFNSCNFSSGIFCSIEPKINIFNMPTNMTMREFLSSKYYGAIISSDFNLAEWIPYTEEEMEKDESKKLIGGYLKTYTYQEACKNWWNGMSSKNKAIICSMPNFDANVFKEITGIEVTYNVDKKSR